MDSIEKLTKDIKLCPIYTLKVLKDSGIITESEFKLIFLRNLTNGGKEKC